MNSLRRVGWGRHLHKKQPLSFRKSSVEYIRYNKYPNNIIIADQIFLKISPVMDVGTRESLLNFGNHP